MHWKGEHNSQFLLPSLWWEGAPSKAIRGAGPRPTDLPPSSRSPTIVRFVRVGPARPCCWSSCSANMWGRVLLSYRIFNTNFISAAEKAMEEVILEGPLRDYLFCKVPPNTTLGVTCEEDFLLQHPFGEESREMTSSGKSQYMFLKRKGEQTIHVKPAWWKIFLCSLHSLPRGIIPLLTKLGSKFVWLFFATLGRKEKLGSQKLNHFWPK